MIKHIAAFLLVAATAAQAADVPRQRTPIAGPDAGTDTGAARDVAAVIDRLSAAMQGRDVRTLQQVLLPDATLVATRRASDGAPSVRRQGAAEWIAQIGAATQTIDERIGRPDITLADGAAAASAPYRFYLGGKLQHCGTDFFHLVQTADGWRIASIAYNVTTEGCGA